MSLDLNKPYLSCSSHETMNVIFTFTGLLMGLWEFHDQYTCVLWIWQKNQLFGALILEHWLLGAMFKSHPALID